MLWWSKILLVEQETGVWCGCGAERFVLMETERRGGDTGRDGAPNQVTGSSTFGFLVCETSLVSHSKG